MRKCRTCRKIKPDDEYVRDFPHCTECIIEHEPAWTKINKRSLFDFLNERAAPEDSDQPMKFEFQWQKIKNK
jgi:hypothetical protein